MKHREYARDAAMTTFSILFLILVLASRFLPLKGYSGQDGEAVPSATGITDLTIFFKLDSRLTRGLYMGDRWVSPRTYTGTGGQDTVEARAQGLDANGKKTAVSPEWAPSDPEMVTVSPGQGSEVKITVKRAGECRLHVRAASVSKELAVKAAKNGNVIQVEITQPESAHNSSTPNPTFKSPKEKLSYALGMSLVSQLRNQGVELDADFYAQGLRDALSGSKTLLTEAEARAALMEMQDGMKRKQMGSQAEKVREFAAKNQREGEAFLAGNKTKEGVVTLESGLQYKVLKAGDGPKPTGDDTVVCHYRGTLIDGTEFDSSYKRNQPTTFLLKRVIKGWTEALQLMPAGSRWQIFIPASLAYGERGAPGKIEPNATLIFEVELLSIHNKF